MFSAWRTEQDELIRFLSVSGCLSLQKEIATPPLAIYQTRHPMSLPELKVVVSNSKTTVAVTIDGHLNSLTVGVLESNLDAVLSTDARRIVLDCSGLSFTSSAGLRIFLETVKQMKSRGGSCAFASLTPAVCEVFQMAGFLETMEVHPSRESALVSKHL